MQLWRNRHGPARGDRTPLSWPWCRGTNETGGDSKVDGRVDVLGGRAEPERTVPGGGSVTRRLEISIGRSPRGQCTECV